MPPAMKNLQLRFCYCPIYALVYRSLFVHVFPRIGIINYILKLGNGFLLFRSKRCGIPGIKPTILHFDDPRKLLLSPALSHLVGSSFKASQPSNYNDMCDDLQRCLDLRASTYCRDMIKHKKLNDANNIFNRMV